MVNLEPNLFLYPAFFLGYRAPFPLCKLSFCASSLPRHTWSWYTEISRRLVHHIVTPYGYGCTLV